MSHEPTIKTIPTRYRGYNFRSRLEARWALFFDKVGIRWEYEAESYDIDGQWYLPDFWLPDVRTWVEIKPDVEGPARWHSLYLAGKASNWREGLDLRYHSAVGPYIDKPHCRELHGRLTDPAHIVHDCTRDVATADVCFAWLDSLDCYGSLVEIGLAKGQGKQLWLALHADLDVGPASNMHGPANQHDLWFACELSDKFGRFPSPQAALDAWLPPYTDAEAKCLALSRAGRVLLQFGSPYDAVACWFSSGQCRGMYKGIFVLHPPYGPQQELEQAAIECRAHSFG